MHSFEVDPVRVAETVSAMRHGEDPSLSIFWLSIASDREAYAARVREALAGEDVAVVVLREALFTNANAVMADVVKLLEANRECCLGAWRPDAERVGVLIIARAPLLVPQLSSPVILPDWVPCPKSRRVFALISDITFAVDGPLNAEETAVGDISERLHDLEAGLVHRLSEVAAADLPALAALWARMQRREEAIAGFLQVASATHASVGSPRGFRPSVRSGTSVVARIWDLSTRSNREVVGIARDLAEAMQLPADLPGPADSLMVAFRRPTERLVGCGERVGYGLIVSVGAACQLVTAAAHADNYARYPLVLMSSLSRDLRRALADLESFLGRLPAP